MTMPASETSRLPAPDIASPATPASKWQREYRAFQQLLPQLRQTHLGQYVVIHDGRVVDVGADDLSLALRFFTQHGNVPIQIGLVTDQPEPLVRIPHYRELPSPRGAG
jgi:hypothetical protein